MSYQVSLGQSLKNMMQSEFQDRLGNQKSIFTNIKSIFINDISLKIVSGYDQEILLRCIMSGTSESVMVAYRHKYAKV